MTNNVSLSPVEQRALAGSRLEVLYSPAEKIPTIVVDNFPALGRLPAMRFLEWVQANPGGAVSLPTGKTPEHFIKWVQYSLMTWSEAGTRRLLEDAGVDPGRKPDLASLRFIQIDEFYPIDPTQHNSFFYYVNKYYIDGFGLDRTRCLLIDCSQIGVEPGRRLFDIWPDGRVDLSLRVRAPRSAVERTQRDALARADDWCLTYEERIRAMGGIGFFLGGIGPDGHVGFNVRGSDHLSTTRLTETNYETQAAASTDLGGIEVSRNRLVITIGLGTIRANPLCTALVIAAGEAKSRVVADGVRGEKSVGIPASALQGMPNARFYITMGAAKHLPERQHALVSALQTVPDSRVEGIVVDSALRAQCPITDLTPELLAAGPLGARVVAQAGSDLRELLAATRDRVESRVRAGMVAADGKRFLHTEPHHDDVMLGYLPAVVRNIRSARNEHVFTTLTSGFTAVTNAFMVRKLENLRQFMRTTVFDRLMSEGYFAASSRRGRNRDVWQYLDGVASGDDQKRAEGEARRLTRDLLEVFDETSPDGIRNRAEELLLYFGTAYPGKKDLPHIQRLKGMCREWEAECLWGYFGWNTESVTHLRLGFYTGDIFTEEPTVSRDVPPIVSLLERVNPDIVTLALDPEASGPDTHYKVLQAIAEGLRQHSQKSGRTDIRVWGYRNVWYRFHPSEANVYVPVSLNMLSVMESAFMNTFVSQKDASFPSHELDGPFCALAQRIQCEQYQMVKTCLGREWFHEHASPLIRAARGLVFLKDMSLDELYEHCRDLRRATENA